MYFLRICVLSPCLETVISKNAFQWLFPRLFFQTISSTSLIYHLLNKRVIKMVGLLRKFQNTFREKFIN